MLSPSQSKVFKTLTQSEDLVNLYYKVLDVGFLGDPDPEYGFAKYPKLIEHFKIDNTQEWFNSKDTKIFIDFMKSLARNHKEKISKNGWRLSFSAFLNFWLMFENKEILSVSFLTDELNWDESLAGLFLNTATQYK
ncbi:hypothetical protein [Acinetobacter guillouiae]|uniref:hypothetical protein n=1 Tax=Acinetobacter guillouiae TaxID=106649 RepID=UPI0002CED5DC|nr:hypothetical protein [Acinetobacter guillouiae]ENU56866.1 hypothetical protein F981_04001 [Acinetobacter guillouiae CIP 63.46]KAB0623929.1 hypothetical protein F7P82_19015 [Acinetobacter guillouiae]